MVLGYHFIFCAYGFWLPNDPRGSWSEIVREVDLRAFGDATKVNSTRSVAHRLHDVRARLDAKNSLRNPPVQFTGEQARAIARGFAIAEYEREYVVHALAILSDHVHLVMQRHSLDIARIAAHLKAKATAQLNAEGMHPLTLHASSNGRVPSPWARGYWCPFIETPAHMRAVIRYAESNPAKAGLRPQRWSMVTPYASNA